MDDLAPAPEAPVALGETGEPRVPHRLYALKDKDVFMVADAFGDIVGQGDGLFHDDTRILSRFQLLLGSHSPSLLSAAIGRDNVFFTSHTANQNMPFPGGPVAPPGVLHIERKRFLWDRRLYERICLMNYSRDEVIIPLVFEFDADFRDMFEVRGLTRAKRGRHHAAEVGERSVTFRYDGLDGIERTSVVTFSDPPGRLSSNRAEYFYPLGPEGRLELYIEIGLEAGPTPTRERFRSQAARARFDMRARRRKGARLRTSGRLFSEWIEKSRADLALLITEMDTGPYPYAGIPWFSTCFGRDGIITAWQMLWADPSLAKGVLTYLAKHQATEVSAFRDSAPGKIQHETRKGEMANLGEVPLRPLLRRRRHHAAVRRPGRRLCRAHRRHRPDRPALAGAAGRGGLDRALWRHRRRRPDRLCPGRQKRPRQPGMERQPGQRLPRRRPVRDRSHRPGRGAGLCLRRLPGHGGAGQTARRASR